MNTKIIITGINKNILEDIQKILIEDYEGFSRVKYFSTEEEEGYNLLNKEDVVLSYKNNALLLVNKYDEDNYVGISFDSFENNNILAIPMNELNEISDNVLSKYNLLIVWYDTKNHKDISHKLLKYYINESNYLLDKLSKINNIYFLDEDLDTVCFIINKYFKGSKNEREEILKEYS